MKRTKVAMQGATESEVREALGEPGSKSGAAGGETWTYGEKMVSFRNGLVVTPGP
ncbi:MAG: hypothetical protein ACR2IE_16845 [Candidatus Sumerlaeaceae bacterium]